VSTNLLPPERAIVTERERPKLVRYGCRRSLAVVLYVSIAICIWRIADLIDELLTGPTKMSLGNFGLEGTSAIIAQVAIILLLLCCMYQTRKWQSYFRRRDRLR